GVRNPVAFGFGLRRGICGKRMQRRAIAPEGGDGFGGRESVVHVSTVIASEAKQSILSSRRDGLLRGACHRARQRRDPVARNDGLKSRRLEGWAARNVVLAVLMIRDARAALLTMTGGRPGGLLVPIDLLEFLVALLRFHRQRRDRTGFQPLQRDRLAGLLAIAVGVVLDPLQRRVDLGDQFALAVAATQFDRAVGFRRSAVR